MSLSWTTDLDRTTPLTDDDLLDRFRPIFERIAEGTIAREQDRTLALEQAEWLREQGFGALRVPTELGGFGVSLRQLLLLFIELAAADSNLVQALRVHFRFGEDRWVEQDTDRGREWLRRIGAGAIIGNASSELTGKLRGVTGTTVVADGERLLLNGRKYYSTGSLYADYISVAVTDETRRSSVIVPRHAPGVELLDDYSGFGQRGSASGTSVFTNVDVTDLDIIPSEERAAGQWAILQLTHLATLAGIARQAADEAAAFVRRRQRTHGQALADVPSADPLVQSVLGRVDAAAHAARQIVLSTGAILDAVVDERLAWRTGPSSRRTDRALEELERREEAADIAVYRAQITVIDLVLTATTAIFEVGGSSALDARFALDRHWRNARTIASHNPAIYREREVGAYLLRVGITESDAGDSGDDAPTDTHSGGDSEPGADTADRTGRSEQHLAVVPPSGAEPGRPAEAP